MRDPARPGLRHRRHALGRRGPPARRSTPSARLEVYGQELNAETYAICRSDMMLKGQDASHIVFGNSFTEDGLAGQTLRLPARQPAVRRGVEEGRDGRPATSTRRKGFAGRFGAGLPRINDGSFLFLQHMICKMKPREQGGSRLAIVFNGSPLFTGAAGLGRVARSAAGSSRTTGSRPSSPCPTSSSTTPASPPTSGSSPTARRPSGAARSSSSTPATCSRRCARASARSARRSADDQIAEITRLYGDFAEGDRVKILPNEAFGFLRITVERPLRLRWEVTDDTLAAVERRQEARQAPARRRRRPRRARSPNTPGSPTPTARPSPRSSTRS